MSYYLKVTNVPVSGRSSSASAPTQPRPSSGATPSLSGPSASKFSNINSAKKPATPTNYSTPIRNLFFNLEEIKATAEEQIRVAGGRVQVLAESAASVQSYLDKGDAKVAYKQLKACEASLQKVKDLLTAVLSTISQFEYLKASEDADEQFMNMYTEIYSKLQKSATKMGESAEKAVETAKRAIAAHKQSHPSPLSNTATSNSPALLLPSKPPKPHTEKDLLLVGDKPLAGTSPIPVAHNRIMEAQRQLEGVKDDAVKAEEAVRRVMVALNSNSTSSLDEEIKTANLALGRAHTHARAVKTLNNLATTDAMNPSDDAEEKAWQDKANEDTEAMREEAFQRWEVAGEIVRSAEDKYSSYQASVIADRKSESAQQAKTRAAAALAASEQKYKQAALRYQSLRGMRVAKFPKELYVKYQNELNSTASEMENSKNAMSMRKTELEAAETAANLASKNSEEKRASYAKVNQQIQKDKTPPKPLMTFLADNLAQISKAMGGGQSPGEEEDEEEEEDIFD